MHKVDDINENSWLAYQSATSYAWTRQQSRTSLQYSMFCRFRNARHYFDSTVRERWAYFQSFHKKLRNCITYKRMTLENNVDIGSDSFSFHVKKIVKSVRQTNALAERVKLLLHQCCGKNYYNTPVL